MLLNYNKFSYETISPRLDHISPVIQIKLSHLFLIIEMPEKRPKGKCVFNKEFMQDVNYRLWLKPGKTVDQARCDICNSEFSVN